MGIALTDFWPGNLGFQKTSVEEFCTLIVRMMLRPIIEERMISVITEMKPCIDKNINIWVPHSLADITRNLYFYLGKNKSSCGVSPRYSFSD